VARPTLRTIAEKLGVSTATVSLAMRDSKKISSDMRKRVKAALVEVGYVYQRSAAGLRTSKTHTVGVIVNNVSDPFFSTLLASLEEALAETGRTVFLCNTNESVSRQSDFMQKMSEYNADGVIVSPAIQSTPEDFRFKSGVTPPLVFVSRTMFDLDFDHVVNDDYEATVLPMNRLLGLGHRRIAFVGGDPSVSGFQERIRGYRAALERASIDFDGTLVRPVVPTRIAGFQAARWIAELEPRPTAAIGYNDAIALGFSAGLQREGLFPGRNFALIGHEDVEEASLANPPLSVTTVSRDEMGRKAASVLVERIENPDAPPQRIVLKTELIIRESCGFVVDPNPG
jgi:LacI family transcriptional regulator